MRREEFATYVKENDGSYMIDGKRIMVEHYAFDRTSLHNLRVHLSSLMMELTIMQLDEHSSAIQYRLEQTREFLEQKSLQIPDNDDKGNITTN